MAKQPRASGFLLFCHSPVRKFLLMKHKDRWDLPKGHVDEGETDLQAAFRELEEETGIARPEVELDPDFAFQIQYPVNGKRYGMEPAKEVLKTLVIFLGYLPREKKIQLTEHPESYWLQWNPPHRIQRNTIDPLLEQVARHLGQLE